MAGLLAELDVTFEGSEISASLDLQVEGLDGVVAAVQALLDGPPDLSDLHAVIGALPLPPGLSTLGQLPTALEALVDGFDLGDVEVLLAPILGPLVEIAVGDLDLSGVANIKAAVCLVQKVLALVTGQASGPDGLALAADQWGRQGFGIPEDLTVDDVRARVQELDDQLDALGQFDGPRFVELVRRLGPRWPEMKQWPFIPVVTDVMEIGAVAVRWSAMDGPQLTAELDHRLGEVDRLIALPRDRVADPLIAQAEVAAALPAAVAAFAAEGVPVLDRVAAKVRAGAKPTYSEVSAIERHVAALGGAVDALGLGLDQPLGRLEHLVPDLELHLMRAVRAMVPPYDMDAVTRYIDGVLAAIPTAVGEPLAEAVTTIEQLDLGFLTDPLGAVSSAVQGAVDSIEAAMGDVEQAFSGLLSPLADGLDSAVEAAGLATLQDELDDLPATLQAFVDNQIEPVVGPIRDGVAEAVAAVDGAADSFDPQALIQPLQDAIEEVAALVGTDEVAQVATEVLAALEAATAALESLDFPGAADRSVASLEEIEQKLAAIDPIPLPEPAREAAEQAVSVIADFDFTGEVAGPIIDATAVALEAGPAEVLDLLQGGVDELRLSLERFRPSTAIGDDLDQPFTDVVDQLDDFTPSDLLDGIGDALHEAVAQLPVIDPAEVIAPLTEVHGRVAETVESVKPSALLAPVDAAIADAVAKLFEATGVDDVFDGIDAVMGSIRDWVELVAETRGVLEHMAAMLADPGDIEGALDELVASIVDRLDLVEMDSLASRFAGLAATVGSVERGVLAPRMTRALRQAQAAVPPALAGDDTRRVVEAGRAFPLAQLTASRSIPVRDRLIVAVERLVGLCDGITAADPAWQALSADIDVRAPRLEADLGTYARLSVIDGQHVFADCIVPTATRAELKASVAAAVRDGLELPVTVLFGLFTRLAPLVGVVAAGLADLIGAIHAKLDLVTGAGGVGGVVDAIEEAADLLRNLDLSPLTDPLDAIHTRLTTVVAAVDPAPLAAALEAVVEAVTDLLDLSTILDPALVAQLDATYAEALDKLRSLSPSVLVATTLDPVYEDLLADILPLLDLPGALRELLAAAQATLSGDLKAQLARVEAAFDAVLRALPFGPLSLKASVSVEASASASGGA